MIDGPLMTVQEVRSKCMSDMVKLTEIMMRVMSAGDKDKATKMGLLAVLDEMAIEINQIRQKIVSS